MRTLVTIIGVTMISHALIWLSVIEAHKGVDKASQAGLEEAHKQLGAIRYLCAFMLLLCIISFAYLAGAVWS